LTRYWAIVAMYLSAALATVGCAWAWGPSGKWVALFVGFIAFLFATIGATVPEQRSGRADA
jgi:predicted membrane metal-binding protein